MGARRLLYAPLQSNVTVAGSPYVTIYLSVFVHCAYRCGPESQTSIHLRRRVNVNWWPPPPWQHWTFSDGEEGKRGRGWGWKRVWVRCAGVSRQRSEEGQSAPELRAKQPLSAVKFVAEGGQSGPGWWRWRVGGGRSCSRGWLHYLYLKWLSRSHYLSHLIPFPIPPSPFSSPAHLSNLFLCLFFCPSLPPITDQCFRGLILYFATADISKLYR